MLFIILSQFLWAKSATTIATTIETSASSASTLTIEGESDILFSPVVPSKKIPKIKNNHTKTLKKTHAPELARKLPKQVLHPHIPYTEDFSVVESEALKNIASDIDLLRDESKHLILALASDEQDMFKLNQHSYLSMKLLLRPPLEGKVKDIVLQLDSKDIFIMHNAEWYSPLTSIALYEGTLPQLDTMKEHSIELSMQIDNIAFKQQFSFSLQEELGYLSLEIACALSSTNDGDTAKKTECSLHEHRP